MNIMYNHYHSTYSTGCIVAIHLIKHLFKKNISYIAIFNQFKTHTIIDFESCSENVCVSYI